MTLNPNAGKPLCVRRILKTARFQAISVLFVLALLPSEATAHSTGENYVFLSFNTDSISGYFEIHEKDLREKLEIDMPQGSSSEVDPYLTKTASKVHDYIRSHFSIRAISPEESKPYELTFGESKLFDLEVKRFGQYHFSIPVTRLPDVLEFDHRMFYENDRLHRGLAVILYNEHTKTDYKGEMVPLVFSGIHPVQQLDISGEIESIRSPSQFVWEGIWHIWIGLDHILFLAVLLLPAVLKREDRKWAPVESFSKAGWNVLKIVTVFTVAHSITLTLAALEIVRLSPRIVESVIALSIIIVAANNIRPFFKGTSLLTIFGFGLFHGLGFASVMGALPFRIAEIERVILAFNIGVELGQVAIVIPVFLLLFFARRSRAYVPSLLIGGSALFGAAALFWFVQRAFNLG